MVEYIKLHVLNYEKEDHTRESLDNELNRELNEELDEQYYEELDEESNEELDEEYYDEDANEYYNNVPIYFEYLYKLNIEENPNILMRFYNIFAI